MKKPETNPRRPVKTKMNGLAADEKRLEQRETLRTFVVEGAHKHARTLDELAKE